MHFDPWLTFAYGLYWVWVISGWADFKCHRKSDIARTSGMAESVSHLWELGILGLAVFAFLTFRLNAGLLALLSALITVHAIAGYADMRIAFTRARVVMPWEQLVHSVLNMAPWVALLWIGSQVVTANTGPEWLLRFRKPLPSVGVWLGVLAPPFLANVVPALREYSMCRAAMHNR